MFNDETVFNKSKIYKNTISKRKYILLSKCRRLHHYPAKTPQAYLDRRVFPNLEFNLKFKTLLIWNEYKSIWKKISLGLLGNQRLPTQSNWLINIVLKLKDLTRIDRWLKDSNKTHTLHIKTAY